MIRFVSVAGLTEKRVFLFNFLLALLLLFSLPVEELVAYPDDLIRAANQGGPIFIFFSPQNNIEGNFESLYERCVPALTFHFCSSRYCKP